MDYKTIHERSIETAKHFIECGRLSKEDAEAMFPELAESEDEKVRKELLEFIKHGNCVFENYEQKIRFWTWLEKQKGTVGHENDFVAKTPKFTVGDKVVSKNNPRLTYDILEVGNINELGNMEYKVEIFADGKPGIEKDPHNIKFIECQKMDEWGEYVWHETIYSKKGEALTPIFRVGDIIIAKDGTGISQEPFHIEKIADGEYWDKENNTILICNQDDFEIMKDPTECGDDEMFLLVCRNALARYCADEHWSFPIIAKWLEEKVRK